MRSKSFQTVCAIALTDKIKSQNDLLNRFRLNNRIKAVA